MTIRSSDLDANDVPTYLQGFLGEAFVVCPSCSACARVKCNYRSGDAPRFSCLTCGHTTSGWAKPADAELDQFRQARCPRCNVWMADAALRWRAATLEIEALCGCGATKVNKLTPSMHLGAPVDPYLRLPLWLRTEIRGHVLWAYNRKHLEFLQQYIQADLRQRVPNRNASLASRLPVWMKSAKLRADVVSALDSMVATLP